MKFIFLIFIVFSSEAAVRVGVIEDLLPEIKVNSKAAVAKDIFWGDIIENQSFKNKNLIIFPSLSVSLGPKAVVKIVGNVIQKNGKGVINVKSLMKVLKGSIVAELYRTKNIETNLQIRGKSTISSIRGTTFAIDSGADNEITVIDGSVDVKLVNGEENEYVVKTGDALNIKKRTLEKKTIEKPRLISLDKVESKWTNIAEEILQEHHKQIGELFSEIQKDSIDFSNETSSEIKDVLDSYKD